MLVRFQPLLAFRLLLTYFTQMKKATQYLEYTDTDIIIHDPVSGDITLANKNVGAKKV
ncbi:MAG: hypothetical protein LBG52_05650 [Candidatus Peribacteria bacterium]|jgi:hypothetical protein|nr:hypothetical protein [Candidatus Peribacteria bacterium]